MVLQSLQVIDLITEQKLPAENQQPVLRINIVLANKNPIKPVAPDGVEIIF